MLITRETDYAMRILRALSMMEQTTVGEICEQEFVPKQFAYRIVKKLERAGLVEIFRGANGGCRLVADPKNISLYEVIEIMGVDSFVNACLRPDFKCRYREQNDSYCTVHEHLHKIQSFIEETLRQQSLYDVLQDEKIAVL